MSLAFWKKRAPTRTRPPAPQPTPEPTPTPPQPPTSNLQPIRITNDLDGELLNRMYAYWSSAWVDRHGAVFAFVGHVDGRPRFFRLDPNGLITRIGPMLAYSGTGEGWSWTSSGDIMLCDGPRLRRVSPFTGADVVVMDISESLPGCRLWQSHSSDDGRVHSATVQQITNEGAYPKLGTAVQEGNEQRFFPSFGDLDESHLSADGSHLIIEQSNDNIIIELGSVVNERLIRNAAGALAHIDCGPGYAVGEDDQAGACTYLDLRTLERRVLFSTWNMGHVSVRAGRCLLSDSEKLALVALDGSGVTPLVNHGMVGSGYDYQVHGNLSPDGRCAAWVSNQAGRFDLYLMRL